MSCVLEEPGDALVGFDCSLRQVPGPSLWVGLHRHGQSTVRPPALFASGGSDNRSPDQRMAERNPVGVAVYGNEPGILCSCEVGKTPGRRSRCLEDSKVPRTIQRGEEQQLSRAIGE